MNRQVAEEGLTRQYGLAVGKSMDAQVRRRILADDMPTFAVKLTAAAADARMAGVMMPGQRAIPAAAIRASPAPCRWWPAPSARKKRATRLARALIMSHLASIHIKHHLKGWWRGTAAACGPCCWPRNGPWRARPSGLRHCHAAGRRAEGNGNDRAQHGRQHRGHDLRRGQELLRAQGGFGLDARPHGRSEGIQAVMLAMEGSAVPGNEGIVDEDIEICIANRGRGRLGASGLHGHARDGQGDSGHHAAQKIAPADDGARVIETSVPLTLRSRDGCFWCCGGERLGVLRFFRVRRSRRLPAWVRFTCRTRCTRCKTASVRRSPRPRSGRKGCPP